MADVRSRILAALDASHDAAARGWSELATDLLTYAYRLALELLRALVRGDAMIAAASRAHAEGRAVQVLALVAPWSPTHGTEYTAGEARRLGLEVVVQRFGEG